MRGKVILLVGIAIGYVLGARAGRGRYEQIKAKAQKLWDDPRVQKQVHQAEDFAKEKAPEVAEFLGDGAKKVVSSVAGKTSTKKTQPTGPQSTTAHSTTAQSTTKPTTAE